MDGDHDIETCYRATRADAAQGLRRALPPAGRPATECSSSRTWSSPGRARGPRRARKEVAELDDPLLRGDRYRRAVPGIVFLSGRAVRPAGEREPERDQLARSAAVGALFSYGRALQAPALKAWADARRPSRRASRPSRSGHAATAPPRRAAIPPRWRSSPARAERACRLRNDARAECVQRQPNVTSSIQPVPSSPTDSTMTRAKTALRGGHARTRARPQLPTWTGSHDDSRAIRRNVASNQPTMRRTRPPSARPVDQAVDSAHRPVRTAVSIGATLSWPYAAVLELRRSDASPVRATFVSRSVPGR